MARLDDIPPRYITKNLGKVLVFSHWKGQPYVRTKGTQRPRTRSQAELNTVAQFSANSAIYKERDTITDQALQGMVISTQKRELDMWMGLAVGNGIEIEGWNYHPDTEAVPMLETNFYPVTNEGSITVNVNSAAGRIIGGIGFYVPYDLVTFNRYRVIGFGQANAVGQTITGRITHGFNYANPLTPGGADFVCTNTFGAFDSGVRTIAAPPAVGETIGLGLAGSNGTVDFVTSLLLVLLWQAT